MQMDEMLAVEEDSSKTNPVLYGSVDELIQAHQWFLDLNQRQQEGRQEEAQRGVTLWHWPPLEQSVREVEDGADLPSGHRVSGAVLDGEQGALATHRAG